MNNIMDKIVNDLDAIGITGNKGSGKDTVGKYLYEKYGFKLFAYAHSLKKACQVIFSLTDDQLYDGDTKEQIDGYWNHSPRELFQSVGTELFRNTLSKYCLNIGNDIWIRAVERKILKEYTPLEDGKNRMCITDVRFPNERDYAKKIGGIVIRVNRKNNKYDNSTSGHASESLIDTLEADYEIDNDGSLEDLYEMVDVIMGKMGISPRP
jgi:hypothetical protein